MSMGVYNLIGLRFHGRFYTGVISQCHQKLVSKVSVGVCIQIVGRMITTWDELFLKIIVSFDVLVIRKKVLSESINRIDTRIDVVVEVLEFQISVAFEFCINEEFIEFW